MLATPRHATSARRCVSSRAPVAPRNSAPTRKCANRWWQPRDTPWREKATPTSRRCTPKRGTLPPPRRLEPHTAATARARARTLNAVFKVVIRRTNVAVSTSTDMATKGAHVQRHCRKHKHRHHHGRRVRMRSERPCGPPCASHAGSARTTHNPTHAYTERVQLGPRARESRSRTDPMCLPIARIWSRAKTEGSIFCAALSCYLKSDIEPPFLAAASMEAWWSCRRLQRCCHCRRCFQCL